MGFAASGGNATGQLAAVRGLGPRRVSSWRRRHRRDPRGLAPPWGTGMRRGSRQTQRPASEPAGPTVAADDAPTSCLGDNGTASLPWALSTATCSAQVRRPASRPSFPAPSQPQRPTPRCRQICAGTPSSCSNFPGGPVHFRPFPLEKISPAPGNRIRRKFALSKAQVRLAQAAMAHRDTSVSQLCRELGIRPVTLYRYVGPQGQLREQGQEGPRLLTAGAGGGLRPHPANNPFLGGRRRFVVDSQDFPPGRRGIARGEPLVSGEGLADGANAPAVDAPEGPDVGGDGGDVVLDAYFGGC